jgi:hypothetical protein
MPASAAENKRHTPAPHLFNDNKEVWFRANPASDFDRYFVDLQAGLIDHRYASALAAVIQIDGDLSGDQVGGFPGVARVLAIQTDRIFEPHAIGNIEMKNGH